MKYFYLYISFGIIALTTHFGYAQSVVINEIMSSNSTAAVDEDGDFPDWLELYNTGSEPINLMGFSLSDNPDSLNKWRFNELELAPNGFILVFASDKNRQGETERWTTIINWGDTWNYLPGISEPPPDWKTAGFDDISWLSGPTGIGYGDNDDATLIDPVISLYARKKFHIDNIDDIMDMMLHIDFDDAFVAYLNGQEIARANIGAPGVPPLYNETAENDGYEARLYQDKSPRPFHVAQFASILQNGDNVLAIQVHNQDAESSDLTFIPFLSAKIRSGQTISQPPDFLNLPLSNYHTNFRIKSSGEYLILSDKDGNILDRIYSGLLTSDVSRGRKPDGSENWQYFARSTPGYSNVTPGSDSLLSGLLPEFSHSGGFYDSPLNLTMMASLPDVSIYYTSDGSRPTMDSQKYSVPLYIDATSVIKARIIDDVSGIAGETVTHTYFIDEDRPLPVFSISAEPENLWGPSGIYEDNFDLEIPVFIEMFEKSGELAFKHNAGAEVFGSGSAGFEEKSLAIFFRSQYGVGELKYKMFPDLPYIAYESFVLRNGGNDWWSTLIRDALTSNGLMAGTNVDFQAYRPAIVYLNGEYWGIHNIREKVNEHYIKDHYNIDPDSLDMLQYKERIAPEIIHGDRISYNHLISFLENNDVSDDENYKYVVSLVDIENYIDYQVIEIYCANIDWPANNNKFWRSKSDAGKWRWILFDTDTGFGLWDDWWSYGVGGWAHDHMDHATSRTPPDNEEWPNPEWSTFIFRSLLKNDTFKNAFINRFADFLNTRLAAENVLTKIDEFYNGIAPALPRHLERWERTEQDYNRELSKIEKFAELRPQYARDHIIGHFRLSGLNNITLRTQPPGSGTLRINSLIIDDSTWIGTYFNEIPVLISASPGAGYRFKEWQSVTDTSSTFSAKPEELGTITAVFVPYEGGSLVINEINYNSSSLLDTGDWFELYNNSHQTINLTGWTFRDNDDDNIYTFPDGTLIKSDDYLIVAKNLIKFSSVYKSQDTLTGGFGFGLNSDIDQVRIYNQQAQLIDSVEYKSISPWPEPADGQGPTLELINPNKDNELAKNWLASSGSGTPGMKNSRYNILHEQDSTQVVESGPDDIINYPNPFNSSTTISYRTSRTERVIIMIYDILGREVISLVNQIMEPGTHTAVWNGKNARGVPVASGIYVFVYRNYHDIQAIRKTVKL
jgi:hypothetical protein